LIPGDNVDKEKIKEKFGYYFIADEMTYKMGIDFRFADHLASRFKNMVVLETCSGGGFSTVSLARYARHVYSFEIDKKRILDAKRNTELAGVSSKITFINMDIFKIDQAEIVQRFDAAFIDPDWADTDSGHEYRFINSTTQPPSDDLLAMILKIVPNVTLIQPPYVNVNEFIGLLYHELEYLYQGDSLELYCLHFGSLAKKKGTSEYRI
jgi:hypothetical protein